MAFAFAGQTERVYTRHSVQTLDPDSSKTTTVMVERTLRTREQLRRRPRCLRAAQDANCEPRSEARRNSPHRGEVGQEGYWIVRDVAEAGRQPGGSRRSKPLNTTLSAASCGFNRNASHLLRRARGRLERVQGAFWARAYALWSWVVASRTQPPGRRQARATSRIGDLAFQSARSTRRPVRLSIAGLPCKSGMQAARAAPHSRRSACHAVAAQELDTRTYMAGVC